MIKTMRGLGVASVALVLTVGLAACGGSDTVTARAPAAARPTAELTGDVKIDGSSTVGPLSKAAADLFAEEQPKVNVTVGISGTGGGFKKFCNGETDISDASRPIKDEEKAACEAKGVKFAELHRRQRRADRRGEQGQHLGRLPDRRPAEEDLGARLEGQQLEPGRPEVPQRAAEAVRRGHRLGHVRLLHRRDQR